MKRCEYIVAWDDGTWTTVVHEKVADLSVLYCLAKFRDAVYIGVYNDRQMGEDEEDVE